MSSNFGVSNHPQGGNLPNTGTVLYEDDLGKGQPGRPVPTLSQSFPSTTGPTTSSQAPPAASNLGSSSPTVTDVGLNTGGQSLSNKVKEVNSQPTSGAGYGTSSAAAAPGTTGVGSSPPTGSVYEQATRGAQIAVNKAQEASQPIQPYIQKAQETVGPYVQQAKEAASPYVEKASLLAQQGYQATATELDKRGVNLENTQQKLADVSQSLKDYGAVGQARAGEYFQQAVDQAQTIGADRENKNIFATIFGTIALIWLAFGFSITALLALGIAGTIAAVLSRYTRDSSLDSEQAVAAQPCSQSCSCQLQVQPLEDVLAVPCTSRAPQNGISRTIVCRASAGKTSNNFGAARGPASSGVETHYPNPSHPDNSLNH